MWCCGGCRGCCWGGCCAGSCCRAALGEKVPCLFGYIPTAGMLFCACSAGKRARYVKLATVKAPLVPGATRLQVRPARLPAGPCMKRWRTAACMGAWHLQSAHGMNSHRVFSCCSLGCCCRLPPAGQQLVQAGGGPVGAAAHQRQGDSAPRARGLRRRQPHRSRGPCAICSARRQERLRQQQDQEEQQQQRQQQQQCQQ